VGVAIGLVLAAFGAILAWAVNADVSGLNVTAVGVIPIVVGIVVVLLDFFWWRTWQWAAAGPWRSTTDVRGGYQPAATYAQAAPRRRRVVEEESRRSTRAGGTAALTEPSSFARMFPPACRS
jgi:hypothetical protein